jgi:HEAT repeat protein
MPAAAPALVPLAFPSNDASINAARIVDLIENGRESQRDYAERLLKLQSIPIDRALIRDRLLKLLTGRYKSERQPKDDEAEKLRAANIRAWTLYVLPLVAEGEAATVGVLRHALDPEKELNKWCRYWALVGQYRSGYAGLTEDTVVEVVKSAGDDLVVMLAHAILAERGNTASLNALRDALLDTTQDKQWEALRALRVVPVQDGALLRKLCEFVDEGTNSDITYDSIQALTNVNKDSEYSKIAARALGNFVDRWSTYPGRDAMRIRAIAGLGRLKRLSEVQIVIEQLLDENPATVRESACALEVCLGTRPTVDRIVAEAARAQDGLRSYVFALRWLEGRDDVVDQLASVMVSGPAEQRDIARRLLSEVGGMAAIERLRVQSNLMSQHSEFLKQSEEHVQGLFENSIQDAHTGFSRTLLMDQCVFYVGLGLIGVSAALLLIHQGQLTADWVGTGTTGVLGVLYTLLLAKPREQVESSVDHLMQLKVIFLGFLRQLHQTDSAYIRRLLDDKSVPAEDLKSFTALIEEAMEKAVTQMKVGRSK